MVRLFIFIILNLIFIYLDNQLIFPLIQKVIINESIQISFKNKDFATTIELVLYLFFPIS